MPYSFCSLLLSLLSLIPAKVIVHPSFILLLEVHSFINSNIANLSPLFENEADDGVLYVTLDDSDNTLDDSVLFQ